MESLGSGFTEKTLDVEITSKRGEGLDWSVHAIRTWEGKNDSRLISLLHRSSSTVYLVLFVGEKPEHEFKKSQSSIDLRMLAFAIFAEFDLHSGLRGIWQACAWLGVDWHAWYHHQPKRERGWETAGTTLQVKFHVLWKWEATAWNEKQHTEAQNRNAKWIFSSKSNVGVKQTRRKIHKNKLPQFDQISTTWNGSFNFSDSPDTQIILYLLQYHKISQVLICFWARPSMNVQRVWSCKTIPSVIIHGLPLWSWDVVGVAICIHLSNSRPGTCSMRPGSNLAPGTGGLAHPSKVHSQSRYVHRGRGEVHWALQNDWWLCLSGWSGHEARTQRSRSQAGQMSHVRGRCIHGAFFFATVYFLGAWGFNEAGT